jgi:rhodanese-related sulfurtransferase
MIVFVKQAAEMIAKAASNNLKIIDVRTPAEFQGGHIEGAELIPLDTL